MGEPSVHFVCADCGEECSCHEPDGVHRSCGAWQEIGGTDLDKIVRWRLARGKQARSGYSKPIRSVPFVEPQ